MSYFALSEPCFFKKVFGFLQRHPAQEAVTIRLTFIIILYRLTEHFTRTSFDSKVVQSAKSFAKEVHGLRIFISCSIHLFTLLTIHWLLVDLTFWFYPIWFLFACWLANITHRLFFNSFDFVSITIYLFWIVAFIILFVWILQFGFRLWFYSGLCWDCRTSCLYNNFSSLSPLVSFISEFLFTSFRSEETPKKTRLCLFYLLHHTHWLIPPPWKPKKGMEKKI